jgi:hypothetical protein
MGNWTADIMTDPLRDHKLCVELQEDGEYRARLFQDSSAVLQLRIYDGKEITIPVKWLFGIVRHFQEDLTTIHDHSQ